MLVSLCLQAAVWPGLSSGPWSCQILSSWFPNCQFPLSSGEPCSLLPLPAVVPHCYTILGLCILFLHNSFHLLNVYNVVDMHEPQKNSPQGRDCYLHFREVKTEKVTSSLCAVLYTWGALRPKMDSKCTWAWLVLVLPAGICLHALSKIH